MPSIVRQRPTEKRVVKPKGSALSRLQSAWDVDTTLSLLLYGRSGTGKTTLWATFPGPILAIICSGGKKPGELKSILTPEYKKKITAVVVKETKDVLDLVKEADGFNTVVLDHASGLQDLKLKEILDLDEIPVQKSWGLATREQYGECTLETKEILRKFLDLPCNRVIVAQEREFERKDDSEIIAPNVGAALMPKVVEWLNPACDYIVETFIRQQKKEVKKKVGNKEVAIKVATKGVEYCLRTAPDPVYTTKFRVPKGHILQDVIVDPDYDKVMATIKGKA